MRQNGVWRKIVKRTTSIVSRKRVIVRVRRKKQLDRRSMRLNRISRKRRMVIARRKLLEQRRILTARRKLLEKKRLQLAERRRLLDNRRKKRLSRKLRRLREKRKRRRKHHEHFPAAEALGPGREPGVNLIGFSRAEIGIGESVRLAARSLQATGIPFGIMNFVVPMANRIEDLTWAHKEIQKPVYRVNIFHMNADSVRPAFVHYGGMMFHNRYNIGYWHWELPDFPDENVNAFSLLQEVWVPSKFVYDSVSKKSTIPVHVIPHGIELDMDPAMNRDYFGLPNDRFLFLTMYDVQSHTGRKNPMAAVKAFLQAFETNNSHVGLVVKINNINSHPLDSDQLLEMVKGHDNIYLLDRVMNRIEVNGLLNASDAFVSLHRSEGFGLGLAEAMYLGKPAVGTNWSGNVDFMNAENSCPVNYQLVNVGEDWGPYKAYQIWAEPDVGHASRLMHDLVNNPEWRASLAAKGQQTIRTYYSPQAVGERMKQRFLSLSLL